MNLFYCFFLIFIPFLYAKDVQLEKAWESFLSKEQHCQILKWAMETRCDDDSKVFEGDERLILIEKNLNDYTHKSLDYRTNHFTFQESIYAFLEKELHLETPEIFVHDFPRNILNPDRTFIYFVFNSNNELLAVVKGFHRRTSFAKELSSLEKLYRLSPDFSTTTAPIALGKANKDGQLIYLVAETPARGRTIYSMVEDVAQNKGTKRKVYLNLLKKAVARHARALRELHLISFEDGYNKTPFARSLSLELPFRPLADEIFKKYALVFPYNNILTFYNDLEESILLKYPQRLYTHGDLNWSNVFYDATTDTLTYIDTVTVHYSIDAHHKPAYGPREALRDYRAAFARLESGKDLLTQQELAILEKVYVDTYIPKIASARNKKNLSIFWETMGVHERIAHNIHDLESFPELSEKLTKRLKENLENLYKLRESFYK